MAKEGHNSDAEALVKFANMLADKIDEAEVLREDIKEVKAAGKAAGFDMAAVQKLIDLRDEEKLAKHNKLVEAMREYAPALGLVDPFRE